MDDGTGGEARVKLPGRCALGLLGLFLAACQPFAAPVAQPPYDFRVSVDPARVGLTVNRLILGNNVQWVDRGDELLKDDGKAFDSQRLEAVRNLGPSILRYPGGSLADTYRWKAGMGDHAARGESEHFYSRKIQTIRMGTREFLELCEATGAQALITVNVASGTPEEAADWVRQINVTGVTSSRTGKRFPKVVFWEIGNEPYLHDENQKKLWLTPESFAQRANAFIRAMRMVDPAIEVGIPLRSDSVGGVPATPLQGFNRVVLRGLSERIQFVALHNAYLPLALDKKYEDDQLFIAATSATETVKADLDATRVLLKELRPNEQIKLAVTEYNALFSLGKGRSDEFISTQVGAIYVADLLSLFAQTPDLWSAQYWSLSGNWKFGAIANNGTLRPGYHVLQAYSALLHGKLVSDLVEVDTFSSAQTGYAMAVRQRQRVGSIATLDGSTLRVLVFNRDLRRTGSGTLSLPATHLAAKTTLRVFEADNPFDPSDRSDKVRVTERVIDTAQSVGFSLPPAGMCLITVQLRIGSK
jgi:alpha-N-arabinofuranosidase